MAFVESNFNISKVNENADGSFDYGIFQINSHYWCTDHQSHSENICHLECQGLAGAREGGDERGAVTEEQAPLSEPLFPLTAWERPQRDGSRNQGLTSLIRGSA